MEIFILIRKYWVWKECMGDNTAAFKCIRSKETNFVPQESKSLKVKEEGNGNTVWFGFLIIKAV